MFQGLTDANGRVRFTSDVPTGGDRLFFRGLLLHGGQQGAIASVSEGAITGYSSGIPTVGGAVLVDANPPSSPTILPPGYAMNASTGALHVSNEGVIDHIHHGMPFDVNGALVTVGVETTAISPRPSDADGVESIDANTASVITLAPTFTPSISVGDTGMFLAGVRAKTFSTAQLWGSSATNGLRLTDPGLQAPDGAKLWRYPVGFVVTSRWELRLMLERTATDAYTVNAFFDGAPSPDTDVSMTNSQVTSMLSMATLAGSGATAANSGKAMLYHVQMLNDIESETPTTRMFIDEGTGTSTSSETGDATARTGTLGALGTRTRWRSTFTDANMIVPGIAVPGPQTALGEDNARTIFQPDAAGSEILRVENRLTGLTQLRFSGVIEEQGTIQGVGIPSNAEVLAATTIDDNMIEEFTLPDGDTGLILQRGAENTRANGYFYLNRLDQSPIIVQDVDSVAGQVGNVVTLQVIADGNGLTMTYDWFKNGSSIQGPTPANTLGLALTPGEQGIYHCVVASSGGSTTSSRALVMAYDAGALGSVVTLQGTTGTARGQASIATPPPSISVGTHAAFGILGFPVDDPNAALGRVWLQQAGNTGTTNAAWQAREETPTGGDLGLIGSSRVNNTGGVNNWIDTSSINLPVGSPQANFMVFHVHRSATNVYEFRFENAGQGRVRLEDSPNTSGIWKTIGASEAASLLSIAAVCFSYETTHVHWNFDENTGTLVEARLPDVNDITLSGDYEWQGGALDITRITQDENLRITQADEVRIISGE